MHNTFRWLQASLLYQCVLLGLIWSIGWLITLCSVPSPFSSAYTLQVLQLHTPLSSPSPKGCGPFQCCFVPDSVYCRPIFQTEPFSLTNTFVPQVSAVTLGSYCTLKTMTMWSQNCHQYNSLLQDWKNYSRQCLLGINWTFQWSWYQCLMSYKQT